MYQTLRQNLVDGNWGSWSSYGKCSATCGTGTQSRVRSCNNPSPSNGGRQCSGSATETQRCLIKECPGNSSKVVDKIERISHKHNHY